MKATDVEILQNKYRTIEQIEKAQREFLEAIRPLQREKVKIYNRTLPKIDLSEADKRVLEHLDYMIEIIAKKYGANVQQREEN